MKPQHQPYLHVPPTMAKKKQYAPQTNRALLINKQQTKFIQQVMGNQQQALSAIATEQSAPTTTTMKNTKHF